MKELATRHVMLIEPAVFYANPETMDTNHYQIDEHEPHEATYKKALAEFRGFHDMLVENGVYVTVVKGHKQCPDNIFPNWFSTHRDGRLVLYPMMNPNRRAERDPAVTDMLMRAYPTVLDLTQHENDGKYLEANGSLCFDDRNHVAYSAISARTSPELARYWGEQMGYDNEIFETLSHTGNPVYHVDIVMFIATGIVGICAECITEPHRERVLKRIADGGREIMELTMDQMKAFAGNSLEVLGEDNKRMLVMSGSGYRSLREDQKKHLLKHVDRIIWHDIPTIETYGGGSARCMIQEMV